MEKVYIKDKQDNKVLPITHVSAVLDDNGNDIGSVMGAFEDEVRGLVDTPHQEYVTVEAYTDLPATGSKDTIYRVSNYNGSTSQVDASVYSEYAWNGTQYVFLRVNSAAGEVFDITEYNSNTKYANLAAALGTDGANIPQSLRKGGMSVKFVQSSDNNYVQYRYMGTATTGSPNPFLNTANWRKIGNLDNDLDSLVHAKQANALLVIVDNEGKIVEQIDSSSIKSFLLSSFRETSMLDANDNFDYHKQIKLSGKYIFAKTDKDGRILSSITNDGKNYLPFIVSDNLDLSENGIIGDNLKEKISSMVSIPKIIIHKVSSVRFEVKVPNVATGEIIIYPYQFSTYTKDMSEQGGSSTLLCGDMLDADGVVNEAGETIAQANMNAIYMIDANNERKHVGTVLGNGHGCEVREWTKMFVDGKLLDLASMTDDIECATFRIIQKSNCYKVDESLSASNAHNTPQIENGEPVVTLQHYIELEHHLDNEIIWRNRVIIKRDNIKFAQLNMGMLAGIYPWFNEVEINDTKASVNQFALNGDTMNVQVIGDSNQISGGTWYDADTAIQYGTKYLIKQRIVCDEPLRQSKSHIFSTTYSDGRFKNYFDPIDITETFNTGDVISVTNIRKIDINKN